MCSMAKLEQKPHAVCIPHPTQGHIKPMLKLAKLLNHRGFHITFVHTEFNQKRLLKSRGSHALDGLPSFRFKAIPDGLPESDADATQDIPSLCKSTKEICLPHFKKLLSKLNEEADYSGLVPPVSCIVADGVMSFTLDAAEELGIPEVIFWTTSICGFMGYVQYRSLLEKGYSPLKDASYLTNGYLDTVLDGIPGMEGIRLRDIPSFIRTTDPNEFMIHFIIGEIEQAHRASALIFNSFQELEQGVLDGLTPMYPPIYALGPLHFQEDQIREDDTLNLIGSNLWEEDHECLEWLNSKERNSVVYVNFGSITVMTPNQMVEFAWGLANTNLTFMWVIRPDLFAPDVSILPPGFVEMTKERGLLTSWCLQEQVLAHPSVGGFLTHSGWNSTLESISYGVPMVCWPFFAEQHTNCWFCCTKWGIGMEIDSDAKRYEVEVTVRELIVGEKGKEMKKRALEWKKSAEESISEASSGSSFENLEKLINKVLLSPKY